MNSLKISRLKNSNIHMGTSVLVENGGEKERKKENGKGETTEEETTKTDHGSCIMVFFF